jgi:hypothetical protein
VESAKLNGLEPRLYLRVAARPGLRHETVPLPHEVKALLAEGELDPTDDDHTQGIVNAALEAATAAARAARSPDVPEDRRRAEAAAGSAPYLCPPPDGKHGWGQRLARPPQHLLGVVDDVLEPAAPSWELARHWALDRRSVRGGTSKAQRAGDGFTMRATERFDPWAAQIAPLRRCIRGSHRCAC